jgi:hypothetical protein
MEGRYEWRPTMNLRFVERWVPAPGDPSVQARVRTLQQQFTKHIADGRRVVADPKDEWKDVPLETE